MRLQEGGSSWWVIERAFRHTDTTSNKRKMMPAFVCSELLRVVEWLGRYDATMISLPDENLTV